MIRLIKSLAANIATLTLSLVLAILIWGVAVRANDPVNQLQLHLPIEVVGRPADSAVNIQPDAVQIVVEGPASVLDELTTDDFVAEVDLTEVEADQGTVPIRIRHNVEAIQIAFTVPEEVSVDVERIVQREIPVNVEMRGEAGRGYDLGEPFVEPATIRVTGVASRVENLDEARVTVFLDNPQQDVVLTRRPIFYDRQGNITSINGLEASTEEVSITVPVDQLAGYAAKPIIVDWTGEPASGYRLLDVRVEPDHVLVTGQPGRLDALSRVRTETVDITGLRESTTIPVTLALPEGVEVDDVQPIVVEIEIEPILTSSVIRKTPEIRALGQGLAVTLDVEEIHVFLFGPIDKLDSLVEEDVRVTLDLFGLGVGTYRLEPDADVFINDVEIRSLRPEELTVTITRAVTITDELNPTRSLTETSRIQQAPGRTDSSFNLSLLVLGFPAILLPGAIVVFKREILL